MTVTKVGLKKKTSRKRDVRMFLYDSFNSMFDWQGCLDSHPPRSDGLDDSLCLTSHTCTAVWIVEIEELMASLLFVKWYRVLSINSTFYCEKCATLPASTQSITIMNGFSPVMCGVEGHRHLCEPNR